MKIDARISALRKAMADNNIHGYIIPSNDAHQSEYTPTHWQGREWISGFTGSAGTSCITSDHAGLWTDGRYFIQAETELSESETKLHKLVHQGRPEYVEWLVDKLSPGQTIGIDGNICSIGQYETIERYAKSKDININTKYDLLNIVWHDRPALPTNTIFEHDVTYAGKSRIEKLSTIRQSMSAQGVDHHLVCTLDDVAWTLNLRGSDVDFNPVFVAYALISQNEVKLFIQDEKVPDTIKSALAADNIRIIKYDGLQKVLNELPEHETLLLDPANCSVNNYKAINCQKKRGKTLSRIMKAIKNDIEIGYAKDVMSKDGAAIANTFYWLEQQLKNNERVTEADFADMLIEQRGKMPNYVGESFPAIIGYKGNGAIIHYRPYHGKCAVIKADGILLADSGGQYLDGTTDITRTVALGTPSAEEKRNFTLVLKGMIGLTRAKFPRGTAGGQLDILARMHLWEHGLNYGHGTGHGVGFFMNVHEPPQGFAGLSSERGTTVHVPGMLTSNEPGFYKEDAYGIRIENLILTVEDEHEGYLSFDTLTLYPIDIKLIDEAIFTKREKAWLNQYHQEVLKKVSPLLKGDVKSWFELKCRPMN